MSNFPVSRRGALTGGLVAAFTLAMPGAIAATLKPQSEGAPANDSVELQPLISIFPDGRIEIVALLADMGQGVATSMPLILADELDANWDNVKIVLLDSTMRIPPPKDPGMLIAASSRSIRSWYMPLREVAARGRMQLIAAAAAQWGVPAANCTTRSSSVIHPDGKTSLSYGALAESAAKIAAPEKVILKEAKQFSLIGKVNDRRDVPEKTTGAAIYASDVKLPGLLFASVTQGPFGAAELIGYDREAATADPRVRDMFVIGKTTLVAIALDTWSAMQALETAAPRYRIEEGASVDSTAYKATLKTAIGQEGRPFAVKGEQPAANTDNKSVEVDYSLPFLAHATMEPMSCTAWLHDGQLEIWAPTQAVYRAQNAAMASSGLAKEKVIIHQTLLGGGFGRRADSDFVEQATQIAMRVKAPIRLLWSRAEDMKRDYYRPAYAMRCKGSVDSEGGVTDYRVTIAGASILRSRVPVFNGPNAPIDPTAQNGLVPEFYDLPNTGASWVEVLPPVPVGYWRSVAHSQNVFAAESFIDELAHAAGKDPFDFREKLIREPRMAAVMKKLRTLSRWDDPVPEGRARGVAVVYCYDSYFGQVIELSANDGEIQIHRATNVIDCGLTIQPVNVVAQVEGGTIFGLSAALYGDITFSGGIVDQANYSDYRVMLLGETPAMETFIMPSTAPPAGVGETGTPCAAPAAANALFALTGKRLRDLPLQTALWS